MGVGDPGPHHPTISDERKGLLVKEYTVDINGLEHTFLFDDDEAEARGLKKAVTEQKAAEAPANKSRSASNKSKG